MPHSCACFIFALTAVFELRFFESNARLNIIIIITFAWIKSNYQIVVVQALVALVDIVSKSNQCVYCQQALKQSCKKINVD